MAEVSPPSPDSRLGAAASRSIWFVAFGAAFILLGITAFSIQQDRANTLREAQAFRHALARTADAQFSASLRVVDDQLVKLARVAAGLSLDSPVLMEKCLDLVEAFSFIETVGVMDAAGVLRTSSVPPAVGNVFADRSFFSAHQGTRGDALFLSEPFDAFVGGKLMALSRPILGPGGELLGVVATGIRPDFFSTPLSAALSERNGSVVLLGRDFVIRMRVPHLEGQAGRLLRGQPISERFMASGLETADYKVANTLDGVERLVTFHQLKHPGDLVVVVSEDVSQVLSAWRVKALINSGFGAAGIALILLLAFLARRWMSDATQGDAARRRQDALFGTLLKNLPVEAWARDQDGVVIFQSANCIAAWGDLRGVPFAAQPVPEETLQAWQARNRRALAGETFMTQGEATLPDGARRTVQSLLGPVLDGGRVTGVLGINIDVTETCRTEEALKRSLEEKEVMLREIHHRVKNNLQIILSLLSLQAEMDPEAARDGELPRARDRILSMALVHEQLYQSLDLSAVNMGEYVPALVEHIARAYRRDDRDIAPHLDVQDLRLSIERAIPLGLTINELVTNAYKYAFADGVPGRLAVSLRATAPGEATLVVEDDGPGLPEGIDPERHGTLGLLLVRNLAGQLGGTFTLETSGGTRARVVFRVV